MTLHVFRSYKDICSSIKKRLRFLLHDIAPATTTPFKHPGDQRTFNARLNWRRLFLERNRTTTAVDALGKRSEATKPSGVVSEPPLDHVVSEVLDRCVQRVVDAVGEGAAFGNKKQARGLMH